jgi:hypothetical protein
VIDVNEALRQAVRDLAGEGRPVDLADRALTAAVLVWPQWTARHARPPHTTPRPEPSLSSSPWPRFAGLPAVPAMPAGAPSDRLVVAAYTTHPEPTGGSVDPATVATFVLDPTTGRYVRRDVDSVRTFSPDLRFALVTRYREVAVGGSWIADPEFGVYDTVSGRVVGRIDVDRWVAPLGERSVWHASWSPDGRSIVLSIRRGIQGRGWLADRLVFVDVLTGDLSAVDLPSAQGFEPQELLGWTADSGRIALMADRAATDQAPHAHIVYDRAGQPIAVHPWPEQSNPLLAIDSDQLLLVPMDPGEILVMDLPTGVTLRRYPTEPVSAVPSWGYPLGWRDGTLIYRQQVCSSDTCRDGREVLGVTPATGRSRTLHTLPEAARHIIVAAGGALTGTAAGLTW